MSTTCPSGFAATLEARTPSRSSFASVCSSHPCYHEKSPSDLSFPPTCPPFPPVYIYRLKITYRKTKTRPSAHNRARGRAGDRRARLRLFQARRVHEVRATIATRRIDVSKTRAASRGELRRDGDGRARDGGRWIRARGVGDPRRLGRFAAARGARRRETIGERMNDRRVLFRQRSLSRSFVVVVARARRGRGRRRSRHRSGKP